jgi:Tfp pilus assembly protein PilF
MDAGFILQDLEDRLVEYKIESDEPAAAGLGISPIKIPETFSPFATPPRGSGRPPMAPNNERFVTPTSPSPLKQFSPEKPVQASVGITLPTCSNLSAMMAHSALLNGKKYLPDMPLTAAANSSYKTSFGTSDRSPLSTSDFARQKGAKFVKDDDSISTRTPSPDKYGNRVALVTGEGDVKRGISVKRWSKIAPGDSVSSKTYTGSQPRKQMGPADVDGGVFVDAERHLNAIHEMAAEHLAHGEYEEAFEVFEEILRGQKERYGPDHYRVGTALHNIGIVHLKSGNVEKAVKVCEEAVKVRKRTLVPNHPDVAVSLAQLGVARLECRQYKDALVAFREALQIRRNFLGPKHPKVGKILNNIGCALYEMGELDGARLAFEEALEIQRDTLRNSPSTQDTDIRNNTNQMLLSIAATLCNLGSIQFRSGMYEEAGLALEEALLVSLCQMSAGTVHSFCQN